MYSCLFRPVHCRVLCVLAMKIFCKLLLDGGTPATGTCRIDYIWIDDSKPTASP